ncbi:hypothetical protein HYALB_00007385 [Hymenoscyphus albidus]|uniref:Cytochrome P450 n=1 Tax=Hymenoscyphus albidus TaxID=595503 RepID=A0A9N9Q499_9HELO|nr:hypothetical protein HYALB_00007385 [Hymenoscyphus albidus]
MHQYISHELDTRYKTQDPSDKNINTSRSKSIIDLALTSYISLHHKSDSTKTMDPKFKALAISQIRTFLFAGHDTTSSTLSYTFHLLSLHPSPIALLIAEHNGILGPTHDTKTLSAKLSSNPHLLNQLPYTTSILKETLQTFLVWINSYSLHRSPTYWDSPDSFLPERWLVPAPHEPFLHPVPVKGAFRPSEEGKRSCIGQELAMMEMKVVLVMVVRGLGVRSVYEEFDGMGAGKGMDGREGVKMVQGERSYQVLRGSARPRDGMPCLVEVRERVE